MQVFIEPHMDDAVLFGCFTLLRNKPLVISLTDSWIQYNRGEDITAEQRWEETRDAMKIIGCPVIRMGIGDDQLNENSLRIFFNKLYNFDTIYVPAVQGGNEQHDMVGKFADSMFSGKCNHYTTYSKTEPYTKGNIEIIPTIEEIELKNKALDCYQSQIGNSNNAYFEAVRGKSEWFI